MIVKYSQLKQAGATKQQIDAATKKLNLTAEELLYLVNKADPTPEHKFEAWLIKQLVLGKIKLPADSRKVQDKLLMFMSLINKKQIKEKDINKYSYEELTQEIDRILDQDVSSEDTNNKLLSLPGVEIFGQNRDWFILKSEDPESSVALASGTKWCTSNIETAEEYESGLLIVFKKMGKHLEKMFQFTPDGYDFKDIQDNNPTHIEDSLGLLILESTVGTIYGILKTLFIVGWNPPEEIKKKYIMLALPEAHISENLETISETNQHDYRMAFLQYKKRGTDIEFALDLLYSYFDNYPEGIPRWPEFEQAVLKDKYLFDRTDPKVLSVVNMYVEIANTEERIPIDTLCFNFKEKDYNDWAYGMYEYFKKFLSYNRVRIPEFEKYIEKLITKKIPNDAKASVASLIGEYWIRVGKKGEEWPAVEDFLKNNQNGRLPGLYSSGWERYLQAVRG